MGYDRTKAEEYLEELEFETVDQKWSPDDQLVFQSVFGLYGKNFEKIRCWLPEKSMRELIEYYYHLKSRKQIISPEYKEEQTLAANTDSQLKRCAERVNQYEHVYDIGELQKDIGKINLSNIILKKFLKIENSCKKLKMDTSEEVRIAELDDEIVAQQIQIQELKQVFEN